MTVCRCYKIPQAPDEEAHPTTDCANDWTEITTHVIYIFIEIMSVSNRIHLAPHHALKIGAAAVGLAGGPTEAAERATGRPAVDARRGRDAIFRPVAARAAANAPGGGEGSEE
jgi:hypothetical protein